MLLARLLRYTWLGSSDRLGKSKLPGYENSHDKSGPHTPTDHFISICNEVPISDSNEDSNKITDSSSDGIFHRIAYSKSYKISNIESDKFSDNESGKITDNESDKITDNESDKLSESTSDKTAYKISCKISNKASNSNSDKISDIISNSTLYIESDCHSY